MATTDPLLPRDALADARVAISVSESPNLARLGLLEEHFKLALGEIARVVLLARGKLAYGGHLDPEGYTPFLVKELQRYGHRDRPLLICLAWQEHRRLPLTELRRRTRGLGRIGRVVCLDPAGTPIDDPAIGRGEDPEDVDEQVARASLTGMRRYMTAQTQGRVLIGGKRSGFQGRFPGLMEEAMLAVEAGQPLYLAGGFGGVTIDIVRALGVDRADWLPPVGGPAEDPRLAEGRDRLQEIAGSSEWTGLRNGLTDEENQRLAASHRPSDIAALVSLGLSRISLR